MIIVNGKQFRWLIRNHFVAIGRIRQRLFLIPERHCDEMFPLDEVTYDEEIELKRMAK